MKLLRVVLYVQALVWAGAGLLFTFIPGVLLHDLLGQPEYADYALVRINGIEGFILALFMVMVAHRIETLWWWSWAFAFLAAAMALVSALNALISVPEGAAVWPWWAFAGIDGAFAVILAWGLARAGQEKPIV